jgi:anti-sigma-K factor RskA
MAMSEPAKMSRRDELETLLPFYLTGTLEGEDLAAVEEWLASDPAAADALAEAEAEFSGVSAANEAVRPPADALARFNRMLDAEAGPERRASPSTLARLWQGFLGVPSSVAWGAAAAAIALLMVQAVLQPIGYVGDFEIAGTEEAADMPFVFVTFKPEATIADVSAFLAENGATVLAGPAAGGVFKIGIGAVTAADYDRIVGLIAAQPFAETVVPGRKPADGG